MVYPGLVILGLAVAGVSLSDREAAAGLGGSMALVSVVLSFGPYLFVRNTLIDVPLPFFLLRVMPGLDAMRVPGRFGLLGALGIAVLAAVALGELVRRWPARANLLVGLVAVVTVFELFPRTLPRAAMPRSPTSTT